MMVGWNENKANGKDAGIRTLIFWDVSSMIRAYSTCKRWRMHRIQLGRMFS